MHEVRSLESFDTPEEARDYLVDTGCIYFHDLDDDNQPVYLTDFEQCEIYAPWYLKEVRKDLDDIFVRLIEAGVIQPSGIGPDGEPFFELTEAGKAAFKFHQ